MEITAHLSCPNTGCIHLQYVRRTIELLAALKQQQQPQPTSSYHPLIVQNVNFTTRPKGDHLLTQQRRTIIVTKTAIICKILFGNKQFTTQNNSQTSGQGMQWGMSEGRQNYIHGPNCHDNEEPAGATEIKCNKMEVILHCIRNWSSQNTVVLFTNIPITTPQLRIVDWESTCWTTNLRRILIKQKNQQKWIMVKDQLGDVCLKRAEIHK